MITSLYQGGLGNLLFQVSIGFITASKKNETYKINPNLDLGRGQGYPISKYLDTVFKKIETTQDSPSIIVDEEEYDKVFNINDDISLKGFFQNSKYYKEYKKELNELFGFDKVKLKHTEKQICTIQIRTGDFLHPMHDNFNVVDQQYIKNSIDFVLSKTSDVEFYLITDYYELAKKYLPEELNINFLNFDEIYDLKLMSQSNYCIISNSTFGWWGSFLGIEKTTIAPKIWDKKIKIPQIYRDDMIKI
jgi:hypothetical protein